MQTFYLTFGRRYAWSNYYVRIVAPTYDVARLGAINQFDRRWATLYLQNKFYAQYFEGELMAIEVDEDLNTRMISVGFNDEDIGQ